MGPCRALPLRCQAVICLGPVRPPHAAARPIICPWAPVPPPHAAARVQSVSWVPVRPPIAAVSIATLLPCATFRSPHTAGGFPFCHRVLMAHHCSSLHRHKLWLHTLVFWPS
ncbi:unnamed protein product [Staurois parvus]|uniref:Secreted protein n=1 Tax=Staurois parvus TaxID=386267 RepID=A0ABN9C3T9_9NEOB|nr:unnamed protein product [Staurois parvus]